MNVYYLIHLKLFIREKNTDRLYITDKHGQVKKKNPTKALEKYNHSNTGARAYTYAHACALIFPSEIENGVFLDYWSREKWKGGVGVGWKWKVRWHCMQCIPDS